VAKAKPRPKRADHLGSRLHPTVRFFWGLGLLACLVFAGGWEARGLLMLLGMGLALGSGKRVSLPYFAFLIATVVLFNLLLPEGKVWFQAGPWPVTEGAFFLGLGKSCTFAGLVFFSLASISRDLHLPGEFGALWAKTFSWYEQLMDQRRALKPRALLMSIDRLLERLYPTRPGTVVAEPEAHGHRPSPTRPSGWLLVVLTLVPALVLSAVWR
jgi:heptaprenyl diphosphate synthase